MKTNRATQVALAVGLCSSVSHAQSSATACSTVLVPTYSPPSVASGWQAQLVAGGLTKPRSIQFDSTGALIVVESGKGISRHTFTDNGGTCLSVATSSLLVNQTNVCHASFAPQYSRAVRDCGMLANDAIPAQPWPRHF